jgi:hypothetical protein
MVGEFNVGCTLHTRSYFRGLYGSKFRMSRAMPRVLRFIALAAQRFEQCGLFFSTPYTKAFCLSQFSIGAAKSLLCGGNVRAAIRARSSTVCRSAAIYALTSVGALLF